MIVGLDIGAGNKSFAKKLVNNNSNLEMIIFCGEHVWNNFFDKFNKINFENEANKIILNNKKGIYLIDDSRYTHFNLPDNSLDFVTVNSPHPISLISNNYNQAFIIQPELDRCLKNGGIFFFGHSTHISLKLSDNYKLISEGFYENKGIFFNKHQVDLSSNINLKSLPKIYPASQVIQSNINEFRMQQLGVNNNFGREYIYNVISLYPNYKLWQKK